MESELASFLGGRVMTMIAAPGADGALALARSMGLHYDPLAASAVLLVSRSRWPGFLEAVRLGAPLAVTAAAPETYRSFQLKGLVQEIGPPTPEDLGRAEAYFEDMTRVLAAVGVARPAYLQWLTMEQLAKLRLDVTEIYEQTPGPRAGARVPA